METKLPEIGALVVTSDGHMVGNVSEIDGACFKIDVPMGPDDWLSLDVIASVDREVHLSLSREELHGRPERREHEGLHLHEPD